MLKISPDQKWLAGTSGTGEAITLLDAQTGKQVRAIREHTLPVYDIRFSHDSLSLLSGGQDNRAILWDIKTGSIKQELKGHGRGYSWGVTQVAFHRRGSTLSRVEQTGRFDSGRWMSHRL